ncbi:uncharacterized protein [Panulirus ornatus]|uniref:uncharacterized protein isoform X2 n=1 Tax=Panulirus ornatus TaxID=150431 RepID=UPI003A8A3BDC
MFIKGDVLEKLLCCRRKVVEEDVVEKVVEEEVVLQHTNNNKTEYITSAQLVEKLKGGTTAVVALVREKRLVVAWLGDSQALLVRLRSPVKMVEPHRPELPVEKDRVEELGGCVINIQGTWRVLGQLAVSRAIGDREYKPYVSSECDIKSLEIEGDEDFLILACDGLWDTLSPEAAVNVVYAYLTHNDGDTDGVGRCLVEAARNTGSEDNITAVVVFLRPVTTLMEEEAHRIAQGQVLEPVPTSVLSKDATPSSINAIFSPPINQFEYSSPTIPSYNPFEGESPLGEASFDNQRRMETEEAITPASWDRKGEVEPMEGTEAPMVAAHDSDSDEVAAFAGAHANAHAGTCSPFNPHDAPTPTAEEVDAALAELDSIPDGVCESGEVEEEEEEEEEWSYYRMEPQTQPQGEEVLAPSAAAASVPERELVPEQVDVVHDEDIVLKDQNKIQLEERLEDYLEEPQNHVEDYLKEHKDQFEDQQKVKPQDHFEDHHREPSPSQFEEHRKGQPFDQLEDFRSEGQPFDQFEDHLKEIPFSPFKDIKAQHAQFDDYIEKKPQEHFEEHIQEKPRDLFADHPQEKPSVLFEDHHKEQPQDQFEDRKEHQDQFEVQRKEQLQDTQKDLGFDSLKDQPHDQLMDNYQFHPHEQSSPMEADQPPALDNAPDILQTSMDKVSDFEFSPEKMLMESSMDKLPDVMDNMEPSSPHGSGSPRVPGSPRSVEGFVTSVELNTPEESFGTNFAVNQSQDLFVGAVDQPSGPFSVYVSSSPEPASLDPSVQASLDLANVSGGVTNGQVDDEFKGNQEVDMSPVEIVHAQSTVEVVAPPSPVEAKEPDMEFIVPDQVADLPTSAQMNLDYNESSTHMRTDFMESPTHVHTDIESFAQVHRDLESSERVHTDFMESHEKVQTNFMESHEEVHTDFMESHEKAHTNFMESSEKVHTDFNEHFIEERTDLKESSAQLADFTQSSDITFIPEPVVEPKAEEPVPVYIEGNTPVSENETEALVGYSPKPVNENIFAMGHVSEPIVTERDMVSPKVDQTPPPSEVIPISPVNAEVPAAISDSNVTPISPKEVKTKDVSEVEVKVPKSPLKTTKTPAKGTPDKSSAKTPLKSTTARTTPGKATPTRTPSAKTPVTKTAEKKSPATRLTPKTVPGKAVAEKTSTARSAATKPTTTRPAPAKPSAPRLSAPRPSSRTTTAKPSPTTTPSKTAEKKPLRTATTQRANLTKPSTAGGKTTPTPRSTPPARTTVTRRPGTAPSKATDETDRSIVNGTATKTASRPTTAPRTTTARKPLTTSAKSAAEKETKNTTNRILSTTAKPAPKPASGTTRSTVSRTSGTAARSTTVSNAKTSSRISETSASTTTKARTTSTTKSAASKTTGVAGKKTVVSKTKTTTAGAKVDSVKANKSEVIGTIEPVFNGENKIADEETSVEVIEKCAVEDIMQASTEKIFSESSLTMTTSEQVVTTTDTTEVIVNGDH